MKLISKISTASVSVALAATMSGAPAASATPVSTTASLSVSAASCTKVKLQQNSTHKACVRLAQAQMKRAGIPVSVDGIFGVGTVNAVVNFQRQQKLSDDGVIGAGTWSRLIKPRPVDKSFPSVCKSRGVNICVDQGQRKLFHFKNGKLQKTVAVRTGGFTKNKNGKWFVHRTQKGTFMLRAKALHVLSNAYDVDLPYSLMFNRVTGEYIHQSNDFARNGYAGSSHGCVNVASTANAKWLYVNTPLGSKVTVY